jgi:Flp pilus assembly protein protease CpaA
MAWFVGLVCLIAGISDLWRQRIPNQLTYGGILAGLAANVAGSALPVDRQIAWGLVGWEASLQGFFLIGGLMLVCFVLFNIGGGDVKLLTLIATCLGWEKGLETVLWTFVLGAALGLAQLVWTVGAWSLLKKFTTWLLCSLRLVSWQPLTPEDRQLLQPSLYLAPVAGFAVLIVINQWL